MGEAKVYSVEVGVLLWIFVLFFLLMARRFIDLVEFSFMRLPAVHCAGKRSAFLNPLLDFPILGPEMGLSHFTASM